MRRWFLKLGQSSSCDAAAVGAGRNHRMSGRPIKGRRPRHNPWLVDVADGGISSDPSQMLRVDVFRYRLRVPENVYLNRWVV